MKEQVMLLFAAALDGETIASSRAFGHWPLYDEDLEKFAELVIKECINKIESRTNGLGNHVDDLINRELSECCDDIKKHFGIKDE